MNPFEKHLAHEVEDATPSNPPSYAAVLQRREHRRNRRRARAASAGAVAVVIAIIGAASALRPDADILPTVDPTTTGVASLAPPSPPPDAGEPIPDVAPAWDDKAAPPIMLQLEGREVPLMPWTACYSAPPDESGVSAGGCFDGFPQAPFEDVGDRDAVAFSFPIKGWSFTAGFTPAAEGQCERRIEVPVERTGDHTFLVPAAGPPGDYLVDVFGRGPGGDVITTFAWKTTRAGVLPEASGYLGLVSEDDDGFVTYGLEMGLSDLATTPRQAQVTVTLTAADGATRAFGPVSAQRGCSGEGALFFRQGSSGETRPLDLGPAPFTYRAEVVLDGTTYIGTAVYPRDENDQPPYTDLVFDPPLPAYVG